MKNIVLIVVDSLRADHLGCYGYARPTSPHIDWLANSGSRYTHCYSRSNCTYPSLATIYTGKSPKEHGLLHHSLTDKYREQNRYIDAKYLTIQSELKKRGYATLAFDWLGDIMRGGFDYYAGILEKYHAMDSCDIVFDAIFEKFKGGVQPPFFLFVHLWDTHVPYLPGSIDPLWFLGEKLGIPFETFVSIFGNGQAVKERRKQFEGYKDASEVIAVYDASIANVDKVIGKIFEMAVKLYSLEDTTIIVTADHGESLIEHDTYFTHFGLYRQVLHVPMVMQGVGVERGVNQAICSSGGLYNFLLDGEFPSYSEIISWDGVGPGQVSVLDDKHHYIITPGDGLWVDELYDVKQDSSEITDIKDDNWLIVEEYREKLRGAGVVI